MVTELEALVILSSTPQVGAIRVRALLQKFGSALAALNADIAEILALPEFSPKSLQMWGYWKKDSSWVYNIELANREGAEIIPFNSPQYPKRLLEIHDFPILLYVKGKIESVDQRSIAVIGTRHASIYGKEMAERISQELAAAGYTVVSGLARGVDTAAHRGALRGGRTLAVIGSGLADVYPHENIGLSKEIANHGALISEFPMNTPPDRLNFPQRNRIVSGMTMATLLIEAPLKSGAMITVEKALGQKRKVFALPGRADFDSFKGNHALIKSRQAQLIENATDVIKNFEDLLDLDLAGRSHSNVKNNVNITPEEKEFLAKWPNGELSIDELVQLSKLPVNKVNVLLMGLIMKKIVKEFRPGRLYIKT